MMRLILCLVFWLGVALASVPLAHAETLQQKWIGDVPIMAGLDVETGLGFAFDSADGRIVMIYTSGDVAPAKLETYYAQALPPLGWEAVDARIWRRGAERLTITRVKTAPLTLWKIAITPY